MKLGVARAASLDLPRFGWRDFAEEDRLPRGRTVHHDEPRTPDWGRDAATSRDEPRFGFGDFAEEAADIGEWRRARWRTSEMVAHNETSPHQTKPEAVSMPDH